MHYKSTRGGDQGKTFQQALFATYASDGGLYVPEYVPLMTLEGAVDIFQLRYHEPFFIQ